jgi:hypothetical protein
MHAAIDLAPSLKARCALLWDLDNVTTKHRELPSLAEALGALTGDDGLRFAAARRGTFRSVRDLMADHGIEALSGGSRKDGADRVLLAQARVLSRTGVEAFIVVSNDRRFSVDSTGGCKVS